MPDGQRFDVERAAAEQRRHAIQHARLVVHVYGKCLHNEFSIVDLVIADLLTD
jgi:hypothetical protein